MKVVVKVASFEWSGCAWIVVHLSETGRWLAIERRRYKEYDSFRSSLCGYEEMNEEKRDCCEVMNSRVVSEWVSRSLYGSLMIRLKVLDRIKEYLDRIGKDVVRVR